MTSHRFQLVALVLGIAAVAPRFGDAAGTAPFTAKVAAFARRAPAVAAAQADRGLVLYRTQVRQLLAERCLDCHGGRRTKHGFDVKTRDSLLRGSRSGQAVIAFHSADSKVIGQLQHTREPEMPPKNQLTPAQIHAVAEWIDLGAPYDGPVAP